MQHLGGEVGRYHRSQFEDGSSFFDPAVDKMIYRHPTFYDVPDDLKL